MEIFLHADTWIALLTLTFLEIVLGIDNIIFISITSNKLPENQRRKATNIGLILAMISRIILLFSISFLVTMKKTFYHVKTSWLEIDFTGQSLILFIGGIFLLYKSTQEIHHKMEGHKEDEHKKEETTKNYTIQQAILQIVLIDIVFSFDSVLTAVGMTNGIQGAMTIMIISVIFSMVIMMLFANPVGKFVNEHPTIQMLGLAFLILISFMLITEGAHLSHTKIFGKTVGAIPKGYLYFSIAFSLMVEMLNMRLRKSKH